jgi:hypothetical protein
MLQIMYLTMVFALFKAEEGSTERYDDDDLHERLVFSEAQGQKVFVVERCMMHY